jgi:O-antigen/teichoic acid export membrane protein
MSVHRRIFRGTIASALSVALTALSQLLSVPILTSAWGVETYGTWVMLTTIPAYLALSDLGFASAATSKMTMQFAKGNRDAAQRTFQSLLLLNSALSAAAAFIAAAILVVVSQFRTSFENDPLPVFLLVLYSCAVMTARVLLGALRATQNNSLGTLLYDGWTPLELLSALLIAHTGGGIRAAASTMLLMRIVGALLMWLALRSRVPWMQLGAKSASFSEIRQLSAPALGALAIPIALALNLQGSLLVAGIAISASAAAALAAVRTIGRVAIQVVATINRATMPELAAAGALNRNTLVQRIVGLNLISTSLILIPAAAIFAIFGVEIVRIWTRNSIVADPTFVLLNALIIPIHGLWYFGLNLLLATNNHTRTAVGLALLSGLMLIPAYVCSESLGLVGLAAVLLCSELISVLPVAMRFYAVYVKST